MTVRERIREQPLPGEAEAAARSWPVVEAALAEQSPARSSRRPRRRRAPARARGGSPVRWPRGGAHPRRRRGERLDRRPLRGPRRPGAASLRGPAAGRVGARDLALGRLGRPSRALAPARLVLRGRLVPARAARGGSGRPPRRRRGRGGRNAAMVGHAPGTGSPPGLEHGRRLRRGVPRGPRAADAWEATGRETDRSAAEPRRSHRHGGRTPATCSCTRASAAGSRPWMWTAGATLWRVGASTRSSGERASLRGHATAGGSRRSRRTGAHAARRERSRASHGRASGPGPRGRAASLRPAGGRGSGGRGRHARARRPARRRRARRGSSSRATWTASPGRATAVACCSPGVTPTSGCCSGRTVACAGPCTA